MRTPPRRESREKVAADRRVWKRAIPCSLSLLALACAPSSPPASAPSVMEAFDQVSHTRARLMAVSAVDARVVWASGDSGTWVRTLNGGDHWQPGRVAGADSLEFRDVHAVDADTAYLLSIGTGTHSRIYKTVDGGAHWSLQFTNPDPRGFYDCFAFWDSRHALVIGDAIGGEMAMLATEDGGATWRRIPPDSLPVAHREEGSFAASGTCLATRPGGLAWIVMSDSGVSRLLRTTDGGRHWEIAPLPITARRGIGPQSVAFRDDAHGIVLGGGYDAKPADIESAVTTDGGRTWHAAGRPPLAVGVWGASYVPGARVGTVVAVSPSGAVYSRDDGATWARIDTLNYWSVGFAAPNAGWAVGPLGRITRLGGF